MKTYSTDKIRNIVLLGGTRSGKTTFAEASFEAKSLTEELRSQKHRF